MLLSVDAVHKYVPFGLHAKALIAPKNDNKNLEHFSFVFLIGSYSNDFGNV